MIMNKYFIFFTTMLHLGIYFGGVTCLTVDTFFKMHRTQISPGGALSATFKPEHFVERNKCCFMALLRHIQLYTSIYPPKPEIYTDGGREMSGFQYYSRYLLTAVHLLNNDLYFRYKMQVDEIVKAVMKWGSTELRPDNLSALVDNFIDAGHKFNLWYLEKGYISVLRKSQYYYQYSSSNEYFEGCLEMYYEFNYSRSVLDSLRNAIVVNNTDWRVEMYKTIPYLLLSDDDEVYSSMSSYDFTQIENYNTVITMLITTYQNFIIRFINQAIVSLKSLILGKYVSKYVKVTNYQVFMLQKMIVLYLNVTGKIIRNVYALYNSIVFMKKYLTTFPYTKFNEKLEKTMDAFLIIRSELMTGVRDPKYDKITIPNYEETMAVARKYPKILMYYPYQNWNNASFVKNYGLTNSLLNTQAWSSLLPSYAESTIGLLNEMKYEPKHLHPINK